MSQTKIYVFRADGFAEKYGETSNAYRGGWMIWTSLEKKYLPSMPKPYPDWKDQYWSRFLYACISEKDKDVTKDVWKLVEDDSPMTENEKLILASTFDWAVTKREDIPKLITEYRKCEIKNTTLGEQADIFAKILADSACNDVIAIAVTQTSVVDGWDEIGERDPCNAEETKPYNILTEDKHFYLFED